MYPCVKILSFSYWWKLNFYNAAHIFDIELVLISLNFSTSINLLHLKTIIRIVAQVTENVTLAKTK